MSGVVSRSQRFKVMWMMALMAFSVVGCGAVSGDVRGVAPPRVVVGDGFEVARFLGTHHLEMLGEVELEAGLEEVRRREGWRLLGAPFKNYGFVGGAYWGRFGVENTTAESVVVLFSEEYAFLDTFDVFHLNEEGTALKRVSLGDREPFGEREVDATGLVVELTLPPHSTTQVYFRMTASQVLVLNASLWSSDGFHRHERSWNQGYALLYGMLLVMVFYNLLLYASTRERSYFWYTLYLTGHVVFLVAFRGLGFQHLWPDSPAWNEVSSSVLLPGMLIFFCVFVRSYLRTPEQAPGFDWTIRILITALGILIPLVFVIPVQAGLMVATAVVVPVNLVLLLGGVRMMARGHRAARVFVLASGVLLVNYLVSALALMVGDRSEIFSSMGYLFITFGLEVAVVIEATLLSVGVGDGIARLHQETDALQRSNLEIQRRANAELEVEVARQTTALRGALSDLESAQSELIQQSRSATIGNLVTGVAHEIGNPLNLTLGGAQELEDLLEEMSEDMSKAPALLSPARRCAGLVVRGGERMETILRNLNRLVTTGARPEESRCDVADTVKATLAILHHRLLSSRVEVEVQVGALPPVLANEGELSQVLLNLLLNSVHAMPKGGVITLSAGVAGTEVWMEVRDTGSGIPEAIRGQIFDAFFTTKEQGQGTGLGLSISHQILAAGGGSLVLLESEEGTCFRMEIPIFSEPAPMAEVLSPSAAQLRG
ncbi:MAG: sensor histidine kinase [Myxococcota bacterium]|nr:sensor histidine kinase [Myxococcota bacterium]